MNITIFYFSEFHDFFFFFKQVFKQVYIDQYSRIQHLLFLMNYSIFFKLKINCDLMQDVSMFILNLEFSVRLFLVIIDRCWPYV